MFGFFFLTQAGALLLEPLQPALFCDGFFRDRVSRTILLVWHQTAILLISASE
jgi:hypothetical protein